MAVGFLLRVINVLFTIYSLAIIARSLRRFIPPIGGLDFSPMVALLLLGFVERLLRALIVALF